MEYINVQSGADEMNRMLEFTSGGRQVPVIVENGKITIGHGGT